MHFYQAEQFISTKIIRFQRIAAKLVFYFLREPDHTAPFKPTHGHLIPIVLHYSFAAGNLLSAVDEWDKQARRDRRMSYKSRTRPFGGYKEY